VIAVDCRLVFLPVFQTCFFLQDSRFPVTNQIIQLMQRFDHPTAFVDFFMIKITTPISFARHIIIVVAEAYTLSSTCQAKWVSLLLLNDERILYVGSFAKKTATSAIEYPCQVPD
jgi:hypothetical protein